MAFTRALAAASGGFLMMTRRMGSGSNLLCALWTQTGKSRTPALDVCSNRSSQSIGLLSAWVS
jgi:hypothetical protein